MSFCESQCESQCECQQKRDKKDKKDKKEKKGNKNIVGIVSADRAVTTINPPNVNPLQILPIERSAFNADPPIYVQFNTVNYLSRPCLWNPRLFAFQIKEAGIYNISYHLLLTFLPDLEAPVQVYPDSLGAAISISDCQNRPKVLIGSSFVSGHPISTELNGALGVIPPPQSSTIAFLEAGDIIRIRVKAIKNTPVPVTGKVVILGTIQFPNFNGGNDLLADTRFTIEKCN
jgi:hypothetical protein